MKKILFVILLFWNGFISMAQVQPGTGRPIMQIISDFHLDLNDTSKTTGFALSRAYIGYDYQADRNISCKIILNIGSPEDIPDAATPRRYSFFREASVNYVKDRLHISVGMPTTRHFDILQKFWGKRFICNEFEIRNKYGYIADLGVVMDYIFSDKVSVDFAVTNGEGYSELQLDHSLKTAGGITWRPDNHYVLRFYNDINRDNGVNQYTASAFAGIDNSMVNFGASFHYKSNWDRIIGHDRWGISSTGSLKLRNNFEIAGRYDYSGSVKLSSVSRPWNYLNDAHLIVFGLEKNLSENCKLALDIQDNIPYQSELPASCFIYINALFKL
jgi:hypothetical protein